MNPMQWFSKNNRIEEVSLWDLLEAKENQRIQLPLYQRDAVWSEGRICALWDSLLRGFPMPSFLLLRAKAGSVTRNLPDGSRNAREHSQRSEAGCFEILDGQQRINAIVVAFRQKDPAIRLWLDLAPSHNEHPFQFKYSLHACTKVFPFGLGLEKDNEHDFKALQDKELKTVWSYAQKRWEGKQLYELLLHETFPDKAGCPISLDNLLDDLNLGADSTPKEEHVRDVINRRVELDKKALEDGFGKESGKPRHTYLEDAVQGLLCLYKYRLAFQLVDLEGDEPYILFKRIGRGGVQITQRQLAVSELIRELEDAGNDAVSSFQMQDKIGGLLDTEDIVHGVARVALATIDTSTD